MIRTRPTTTASAPRRAAASLALLRLAALALVPPTGAAAAAAAVSDGGAPSRVDAGAHAEFERLLESFTSDASSRLQEKSSELRALQEEFDAKLESAQRARDRIQKELDGLEERRSLMESGSSLERMHEDMDDAQMKLANLVRRTEGVLARVGEYNRRTLGGSSWKNGEDSAAAVGLEERLGNALKEEMMRRDRYKASVAATAVNDFAVEENGAESEISTGAGDIVSIETEEDTPKNDEVPPPYVAKSELNQYLSPENIMGASENSLTQSLAALAAQQMREHIQRDDDMWVDRLAAISGGYEAAFTALQERVESAKVEEGEGRCLGVPTAVEMVGRALAEYSGDGTGGLADHAAYENGGSVAYELTSAPYVPPPRNDGFERAGGGDGRAAYEREKQRAFDAQAEEFYRQRLAMLADDDDESSLWKQLSSLVRETSLWEWYASFRFGELRPYLPDDWERLLDSASALVVGDGGQPKWSDYTPRGAMDALVPDHLYHALGMHHLSTSLGRTAAPEVAISVGLGAGDGGGGRHARPAGRCYPLSMDPADDPALSLLARRAQAGADLEEDADASLLAGPKYTVRLPYAVAIDAVTLEHRSFPLPPGSLRDGMMGGESAPRWVRVVGFPPCPRLTDGEGHEDEDENEDEDECGVRGFDLASPINLGTFEYRRITVTGREDDYGGGDDDGSEDDGDGEDDNAWPGGRRRSVQTFPVRGGRWTPPSLLDNAKGPTAEGDDATGPTLCTADSASCGSPEPDEEAAEVDVLESLPEPGQCAPPKDEDSLPSCGDDVASSASPSSRGGKGSAADGRHVVEAVSFIIEENWGGGEFTCLYRLSVHGDAAVLG